MSAWKFSESEIAAAFPMSPWVHQSRSVTQTLEMLERVTSLTLALPTGAGKTNCAAALLNLVASRGMKAMVLSNRKMLTEQLSDALRKFDIDHGVRAASLPGRIRMGEAIQISSMQTELSRSIKSDRWRKHEADLLAIDESHNMVNGQSLAFIQNAIAGGAKVVLLTGTPIGMSHVTPNLIVGATNSELRACGAHVPAIVKCIREFDTSKVVRKKVGVDAGEFTEKSTCEWFARHQQQIVGVVYDDWKRFNPTGAMTLGVAPGSEEAITMASEFWRYGTTAAAITARGIYANGKMYTDDAEGKTRKTIDEQWQAGEIKVMWNRFIYREAIDRPGLYHLILATPIGSLKSMLQVCGRAIRKSPMTPDHVIIQDHAGNHWRHGSPNEDRDWYEMYTMTEAEIAEKRKKKNKQDAEKGEEPVCCLKCGTVLKFGRCPPPPRGCGEPLSVTNPSRMRTIIQESGELIEVENITRLDSDPPKKERKPSTDSKEQKQWNQMFWKARNSSSTRASTFEQLRYLYKSEFGSWPPSGLKFMPVDPADMKRKVRAIPMDSLIGCDRQRGSDATG